MTHYVKELSQGFNWKYDDEFTGAEVHIVLIVCTLKEGRIVRILKKTSVNMSFE